MFRSLFSRLMFSYIVVIIITLLVLGAAMSYLLADYYYSAKEKELLQIGREAASIIVENMKQNQPLTSMVDNLNLFLNNRMLVISRENLTLIAGSSFSGTPRRLWLEPEDAKKILKGTTVSGRGYHLRFDQLVIFVAVPVMVNKQVEGALLLVTPLADITDTVKAVRNLMFYAALPALLLSALLGLFLSRSVALPLRRMSDSTRQIASGNYKQRLEVKSCDEIGHLAGNFNRMVLSLEETVGALTREKGKIENILANMAEGVVAVDHEKRVILLNKQAALTLSIEDSSEPIQLSIEKLAAHTQLTELFTEVLKSRKTHSVEYTPDYGKTYILAHVSPLTDCSGNIFGVVGVLQDITELRQLEQLRREFVANVSHELRTPLTSIQGFIEAMLDGTIKNEEHDKYLDIIHQETLRLNKLIHDLLDLSLMESHKQTWDLNEIDVNELIERLLVKMKPIIAKHQVSIKRLIPDQMPGMLGNEDRIEQVLLNLLDNAIRYSLPGGVITLQAKTQDDHITLSIADQGPGIPQEDIEHIWERFHRVDKSRSRVLGGTGLGLAIVKQIVELHGGNVSVQSEVVKGSTFSFTIKALPSKNGNILD